MDLCHEISYPLFTLGLSDDTNVRKYFRIMAGVMLDSNKVFKINSQMVGQMCFVCMYDMK